MSQTIQSWHWDDGAGTCTKEDEVGFDGTRLTICRSPSAYFAMIPVHTLAGGTNIYNWAGDGKDSMFGLSAQIKSPPYAINDNREIAVVIHRDVGGGDMRDTIFIFDKTGTEQLHIDMDSGVTINYLALGTVYVVVQCSDNHLKWYKVSDGSLVTDIGQPAPPAGGTKFLCSTEGEWVAYGGSGSGGSCKLKSLSAIGFQGVFHHYTGNNASYYGYVVFAAVTEETKSMKMGGLNQNRTILIDKDFGSFLIANGDVPAAVSPCGGYVCYVTDTVIKRWIHESPDSFIALDDITLPAAWQVGASGCDMSWYGRYIAILFNTSPKKTAIYSKPKGDVVCAQENSEEIPPLLTTPKPT